jgi:hypothetical protein
MLYNKLLPTPAVCMLILLSLILLSCSQDGARGHGVLTEKDFKFDGPLGSQGTVIEKLGTNLFKVTLGHAPNQPEWNNKLNFQITGNAKGNNLVLYVEGPPVYAMNEYFYSWSYDMENWNPVHWNAGHRVSRERDTLVFPVFEQEQVFVGHQVPISYEQIEEFIAGVEPRIEVTVDTLGKSLGGRNLYRLTISDPASGIPPESRWGHYFSNSHPGEHNAQWRMIAKIEWLLSEEGSDFRKRSICHFVLMMSPDAPSNGWYRVNAQGVDMNRSYFPEGSDKESQAHEPYIFQQDLENIMASATPVSTVWGHHTWGGIVEPLLYYVEDDRVGHWTEWRDILQEMDTGNLIKPLDLRQVAPGYGAVSWESGPHEQFGINAILCEGAGSLYTKEENKESGRLLIRSLSEYYRGTKN